MKKTLFFILSTLFYSAAFSQITLTSTVTNVTCYGLSNGSATVSATGGSGGYTYTWTPTNTNSPILSLVATGQYTVTVMDAAMNTSSLVVTIGQPAMLNAYAYSNPSCFGMCNGTTMTNVFGGTPPYQYNWSNGFNGPQIFNTCPGNYTVTIIDMNSCVTQQTVDIMQSPPITINTNPTNSSCGSSCDGAATCTVIGGISPYTFQWSPGNLTLANVNNLCPNNYTLQVVDANGCFANTNVNILANGPSSMTNATLTTSSIKETCYNLGDGSIDLSISGTNPGPYTYQWTNGATSQDIFNLNTGIYSVTVYDANMNCLTIQDTITADGTNCGSITGNTFIDITNDCIKNVGDNNAMYSSIIINPGNRLAYSNYNGDYVVNNLPFGTYSISLNSINGAFIPTCTTTITTVLNSGNQNSINNNLSVGFNSQTSPDLQVSAWNMGIVPGFICRMNYTLRNLNNVSANGLFKATLPSAFIPNIITTSPTTYTLSGDTVIWNFNNIIYTGGNMSLYIDFTTPLTTPLGSIFTSCMWAQPSISDFNPINNTFCYSRLVTGSFDPNDKAVSPAGVGPNGDIAGSVTDLTYLIRFQNTGNGPAVNIVVKDTLSPNVDVNTFEMLGSSHNYNIEILPGNILKWKFNNIMLPDSNSNEPGSHGYIQYRIKRNNNNTPGTQIKNTAYIYFDFNEPVVTNTAINTIETITGITSQLLNNDGWNVYPNPSTGALYIVNSNHAKEESQIQVLNAIGQTVLEENITSNYKNIDLSKLNNGVYFVKITSDKQSVIKRVVLSK